MTKTPQKIVTEEVDSVLTFIRAYYSRFDCEKNAILPSYHALILSTIKLLEQAAELDMAYQGDMLAEGVREGMINCAITILRQLEDLCVTGR